MYYADSCADSPPASMTATRADRPRSSRCRRRDGRGIGNQLVEPYPAPPLADPWDTNKKQDVSDGRRRPQAGSSLAILSIHARKSHCRTYSRRPRRKHWGPRPCARSMSRVDGGKSAYRETSSQDKMGLSIKSARRCERSWERVLSPSGIAVVAPAALRPSVWCCLAVIPRSIPLRTDRARARSLTAREHGTYCGIWVECSAAAPRSMGARPRKANTPGSSVLLGPARLVVLELSNQFQVAPSSPKARTW